LKTWSTSKQVCHFWFIWSKFSHHKRWRRKVYFW